MKPPVNGLANGPTKTAIAKILIAIPLQRLSYKSAKQAGTIAKGLALKNPEKNLVSIRVCVSFAVAEATEKMLKPKSPRTRGSRRPESSDMGAQRVGPEAKPSTYNVTPRVPTSMLKWNSASTALMAAEKMADAKEATKVEYVNIAEMVSLARLAFGEGMGN
jgi:hypothetical protein